MTEQEAIEELKYDCNELGKAIPCDTSWGVSIDEAYNMAISSLEEVQQYRALGTVEELREARKKQRWIPCNKRLPEEPEEIPTEDEPVEEMVLDGKFKEYIVTIYGADAATTLYYIGSNNWYDGESGECYYRIEAWQPMPEPYIEVEKSK